MERQVHRKDVLLQDKSGKTQALALPPTDKRAVAGRWITGREASGSTKKSPRTPRSPREKTQAKPAGNHSSTSRRSVLAPTVLPRGIVTPSGSSPRTFRRSTQT
ncbi:hypothetical protein B0T26DRAFT_745804 [Lasiosphaeria miniovina]|uniref:Uncharacterized protein n=1 Tax=Lasiosphaeria miniovina TaxID=1954250 RepID=A0AA40EDU1_9PEZI|nr:uncharacterized protein B0T26DRAFT_745804 [Lasiosphaeria miniovina]KAK0733806.1 hypothetical protein B0T26DRAFT_745804 [Lasiosphaeria miniovina]